MLFRSRFVNAELERCSRARLGNAVIDTVMMARQKFPGAPASLDALCKRFSVDNSARTAHGARLDAELLAKVYLELQGGRQQGLGLTTASAVLDASGVAFAGGRNTHAQPPRPHAVSAEELAAHAAFLLTLKNPLWSA